MKKKIGFLLMVFTLLTASNLTNVVYAGQLDSMVSQQIITVQPDNEKPPGM